MPRWYVPTPHPYRPHRATWQQPLHLHLEPLWRELTPALGALAGRVVDVGCGHKPYRELMGPGVTAYVGVDHPDGDADADVRAEAHALPFDDGTFDAAVSFQVLEHLREPARCVREMHRVLRPGGRVVLTAPGVWPAHEVPRDYWRFTRYGMEALLRDAGFVDVRVVAATNRSLESEVAAGRFRQDLLFRLKVGVLKVPPLRQRPEDIAVLSRHFARMLGASLSDEVVLRLQLRRWPGNVRELRNVVERAVMLSGGAAVTVDLIEEDEREIDPRATLPGPEAAPSMRVVDGKRLLDMPFQDAKQFAVENFEKDYLLRLFEAAGYNLSEAARRSGVDRRYLRELFKKHGMEPSTLRAQRKDDDE